MVGEPIDNNLVDALEDGDVMIEGDALYEFRKLGKTTEKNFEGDVEAILGLAGWRTFGSNAAAQADYDRKLALKADSLIGFVQETQPEEWAKIEGLYGSHTRERFLKRLPMTSAVAWSTCCATASVWRRARSSAYATSALQRRRTPTLGSAIAQIASRWCGSCATARCPMTRTTPWTWCSS